MLIPGVAALALWFAASGYLVFQGFYNRQVANSVRNVSIPAVPALASVQQERRLGVAYLAQPSSDLQVMLDQRRQTDERLAALRSAAEPALANAPDSITTRWQTLTDYLDQLPGIRTKIDSRSASEQEAYDFYNDLLDAATSLFDTQARVVPDVSATQGGIAATEVFRASDLMSRAGSTIDSAFGAKALNQRVYLDYVGLVGAYRSALDNVAPHLEPTARQRYQQLTEGEAWQRLTGAENALITGGYWRNGVPRTLPVDQASWETLITQVSDDLIDLTVVQADAVSAETLRTGNNQLLTALLGSLVALTVAVAAIIWAVRQSQLLVDQALSLRLAQLGADAASMVDQRLPALMERLRRHERVDLAAELHTKDYGTDEIGQVADVINRSLKVAAGAAVDEAKTRAAGVAMLMGVARRPQRPLQRGLKVIEDLQNRIGDEKLLSELFDINHQLTQTRRFLENLVILAGGQIGRRFKKPVPVRRVLLAAFAESQHYQRITLRHASDVAVQGHAVAGTVHLLAELLDNALSFSPPETTVWVTCNEVRHGVAVEIEDAGVGMRPEALERANELLETAPTPDITALKDGAQVGLHVVAELAKRDGIQVSLRTSAYGGLLAIVLLPERVIVTGHTDPADDPVLATVGAVAVSPLNGSGRHLPRPAPAPAVGRVATVTRTAPPEREHPDAGAGRRPDRAGGEMTNHQANGVARTSRSPEVAAPPPTDAGRPAAPPAGRPPLPHRQPQQHIAPELREDTTSDPDPAGTAEPARSPEEARNRIARYQRAWNAGRVADTDDTATKDDQGRKA
ncbi:nitrate- and nitrite sensing domain-containing protein [Solwaraspora sp. WMMD1047]|uniref:sensor histidine kinase n=1 Tax=Solwaraspora sp. WMMD1047 TaxID=3016102 RepID=UPI002415B1C3|nr:nitrate- and nitrite sensing domain-containing protein [Solwaraspora sp. WMMD1047]MDG4830793.1 nitrate- and nitrite sensing domain-containing protein [Solwaraspora sp. WMMD1047]